MKSENILHFSNNVIELQLSQFGLGDYTCITESGLQTEFMKGGMYHAGRL